MHTRDSQTLEPSVLLPRHSLHRCAERNGLGLGPGRALRHARVPGPCPGGGTPGPYYHLESVDVSVNLRQPPSSHGLVLYGALRVRDEASEEARGLWEHSAARWHCEVLLAEETRWSVRVTLWALTDAASCEL